jgi:sortase A
MKVHVQAGRSSLLRALGTLLMSSGLLAVGLAAWFVFSGRVYQYEQNRRFEQQLVTARPPVAAEPGTPAIPTATEIAGDPAPDPLLDPSILGRLEIPSLALEVLVGEGVDDATLRKAAGHLPGSARAGEPGNFVVFGHRDTFFRPLKDIAIRDVLRFRTLERVFEYEVDLVAVTGPDDAIALTASEGATATLITCYPFYYTGGAPRRFVVHARLRE